MNKSRYYLLLTARILAVLIFLLGSFMFIGEALTDDPYTTTLSLLDKISLIAITIVLIGLPIGVFRPLVGGYIIIIPVILLYILGWIIEGPGFDAWPMLVTSIPGILFLIYYYTRPKKILENKN